MNFIVQEIAFYLVPLWEWAVMLEPLAHKLHCINTREENFLKRMFLLRVRFMVKLKLPYLLCDLLVIIWNLA